MKKQPIQLLFAIIIVLASCNDNGNTQSKAALQIKDSLKIGDSLALKASHPEANTGAAEGNLMYSENVGGIALGIDGKKLISLIGQPDTKTTAELWGADNAYHQDWNYPKQGITINMMGPADSVQQVNIITIIAPCSLKTKRNIGIGSSMQDVLSAYKAFIDTTAIHEESIIAGTEYGGVVFDLKDKKVQSIYIGSIAD